MTLPWRPWTRARLLAQLRDDFGGAGPDATLEQRADDARRGLEPHGDFNSSRGGDLRASSSLTAYRRLEASTVWHWRPECPAWPAGEYVEHLGPPELGQRCRDCAQPPHAVDWTRLER